MAGGHQHGRGLVLVAQEDAQGAAQALLGQLAFQVGSPASGVAADHHVEFALEQLEGG